MESPDAFCIACGAPLASGEREGRPGRQFAGWQVAAAGVLLAIALAGVATFAALWQSETGKAHRLHGQLAGTRAELGLTKSALATTRARLASTNSLSNKRRAVLLQAQDVLGKVDPLLSSVDNLQGKAGGLGSQGAVLRDDAEAIVSTVADLVNYLVRNSGGYVDFAWVNQEIDTANSEIGTLRYDESVFGADDKGYGDASTTFVTKANAFSASIRALQKQLKNVTSK